MGIDRLKPVLTGSNRTRAAQTDFDRLKPDSNWTRPDQSVVDRLKPDSIRTRPAQTGFERLKPDQTGSTESNRTRPVQT